MPATARPRRSILYMPGANARALDKAKTLPADGVVLDLEDSVAPDAKPAAREQVCATVKAGGFGRREVVIRVNGLDTPWGRDDLTAAARTGADAVLVPKVNGADTIHAVHALLKSAGAAEGMRIWAMMETPIGILHAEEIAGSDPRLECLVMGTNDLAKELHAAQTPARVPLMTGIGLCLLAARAFGLAIVDGVYNDIRDADGFEAACRQGLELGFDGKTLIHPSQVEPCNRVFSPSADEIEYAHRVIAAFEAAQAEGKGVATVDGRMIENLHVDNARRMVAMAEQIAALQDAAA
jgi:citrate lyase subunit beta/citryl-CoA lyase